MKKWMMVLCMALWAGTGRAQWVKIVNDVQTAAQVDANKEAAVKIEKTYNVAKDSTMSRKKMEAIYVTTRNAMKTVERAQRSYLGNLKKQGYTYASLVKQTKKLVSAAAETLALAERYNLGAWSCARNVSEVLSDGQELVKTALRIAFNSSVPNPFRSEVDMGEDGMSVAVEENVPNLIVEDSSGSTLGAGGERVSTRINDGYNLLLADDRVKIANECLYRITTLRRALEVLNLKMRCTYSLRDALKEALPYEYYWALGMENRVDEMKRMIDRL